jgi:hypothetical protein
MIRRVFVAVISFLFMLAPMATPAFSGEKTKKWKPHIKKGSLKAQRYTTKDGKKVLISPDGTMYLLDHQGKHFMVDQNGQKIRVNQAGNIIKVGKQRGLKLRIGPGPLC